MSPDFDRSTIDEADLAKFDQLGEEWWDPKGPMGQLHKFDPIRVAYIAELVPRELGRPAGVAPDAALPLAGFKILDVGCGGGILCESLARLGSTMVGIDPAPNNIGVAARHAEKAGLAIDYRCTSVETLAEGAERFDAVLVMEVVEHVRDPAGFVRDCARLVRPGGLLFGATLNRTLKSWALAIVGAEYVLGWVPRGTHDWHQFVTPGEFRRFLRGGGLAPFAETGVTFNPLADRWHRSTDTGCNYMVVGRRRAEADPAAPRPTAPRDADRDMA